MPQKDAASALSDHDAGAAIAERPTEWSPKATCREVELTLSREPGDHVKCAHLFGDYYRCNWWSRHGRGVETSNWAAELNDHVRKSSFLRVTVVNGRLTVEEVKAKASGPGAG